MIYETKEDIQITHSTFHEPVTLTVNGELVPSDLIGRMKLAWKILRHGSFYLKTNVLILGNMFHGGGGDIQPRLTIK